MKVIRPAATADAFRWEGQHSQEWPQWAKDKGSTIIFVSGSALSVDTSDGPRRVNRGDWVVHFDDGELAVFTHGKFQRTFKEDQEPIVRIEANREVERTDEIEMLVAKTVSAH